MCDYPLVIIDDRSNCQRVGDLLTYLRDFYYRPHNMDYIIDLQRTLLYLEQYVTLIGFDDNGDLGYVDVDMTIKCHLNTLERFDKNYWSYGGVRI